MTADIKPMLAGKADLDKIKFPIMVSPKLDGIRALVIDGVVYSRNMKPIPNQYVQRLFCHLHGYDGELIVGEPTDKDCFRNTTSGVMSQDGEPDVRYWVFDRWDHVGGWVDRYHTLGDIATVVPHYGVHTLEQIKAFEEKFLLEGYEGVMLRAIRGPYKNGRSTVREGWLLKLKQFEDSEALVIGMEERMHNGNELGVDELGQAKRTSHQENLVGRGDMGALIVRDIHTAVEFNIGTGFTDEDRRVWWSTPLAGETIIVNYRFFPTGGKEKPRFPVYMNIRKDI